MPLEPSEEIGLRKSRRLDGKTPDKHMVDGQTFKEFMAETSSPKGARKSPSGSNAKKPKSKGSKKAK